MTRNCLNVMRKVAGKSRYPTGEDLGDQWADMFGIPRNPHIPANSSTVYDNRAPGFDLTYSTLYKGPILWELPHRAKNKNTNSVNKMRRLSYKPPKPRNTKQLFDSEGRPLWVWDGSKLVPKTEGMI